MSGLFSTQQIFSRTAPSLCNKAALNYIAKETPDELFVVQVEGALQVALMRLDRERENRIEPPTAVQMGGHSKALKNLVKKGEKFIKGTALS